jgi:hypothetical protein
MIKMYTDLNKDCKLFYCYSINLYRYFKNNGLRYERKSVKKDENGKDKICWIYKRTEAFEFLYQRFGEEKCKALGRPPKDN